LVSGRVKIEKELNKIKEVLNVIDEERITLGETAIFPNFRKATCSVHTDSSGIQLKQLRIELLFELFKTNPGLASRFYKTVALKFSNLIRFFGMKQKERNEILKNDNLLNVDTQSESDTISEQVGDERVVFEKKKDLNTVVMEKFELEPGDVLIKFIECSIKKNKSLKSSGKLYITINNLCIDTSVLGLNSKDVIPLFKIKEISCEDEKIVINTKTKKLAFYDIPNIQEILNLINELWKKIMAENSGEIHQPVKKKKKWRIQASL